MADNIKTIKIDLIYKKLNHLNIDYINKTIKSILGLKQELDELYIYKFCLLDKFHHINNKTPISSAKNLAIFDVDICGPIKPLGLKGERYFMTITDRGSRVAWVYSIKNKGDVYSVLLDFFKLIVELTKY
jgi:hypothetical protein